MATSNDKPKNGLLSKVARFVANPTTSWSELEKPSVPAEADPREADRTAMKALLELKRRNDFVRQREFNMLRALRRKELETRGFTKNADNSPSLFQSSLPSRPDDKEKTLRKIDEIEAQMSMQWWSTKHGNSSILNSTNFVPSQPPIKVSTKSEGATTVTANSPSRPPPAQQTPLQEDNAAAASNMLEFTNSFIAQPSPVKSSQPSAAQPPAVRPQFEPTVAPAQAASPQPNPTFAPPPVAVRPSAPPPPASAPNPPQPDVSATAKAAKPAQADFANSKLFAVEVEEVAHDAELEEAAIRFANGDDAGAEQALREAIQPKTGGVVNEDAWLALFDLYRATGNQASFDDMSLTYASHFSKSAPQWISFRDQAKQKSGTALGAEAWQDPAENKPDNKAHWKSPPTLTSQSLAALKAALAKAAMPWHLDWSRLTQIEEACVTPLIVLWRTWSADPAIQLVFENSPTLSDVLHKATPTSDNSVAGHWWTLRLEYLRLCHRPDEFEMVALDFCVTYEISPPSWMPSKCKYRSIDSSGASHHGGLTIINAGSSMLPMDSVIPDSLDFALEAQAKQTTIELTGYITGDPLDVIQRLDKALEGADIMVISCEKLIRIDFSAAGTLLNWVIARHHEGRQVQFVQLHRLILPFFHVIGISEHAITSVRLH